MKMGVIMPAGMHEEEKKSLKRLAEVLEEFTQLRPNMPAYHVVMLLQLALDEGKPQKYCNKWSLSPATVSRILLDFSKKKDAGRSRIRPCGSASIAALTA